MSVLFTQAWDVVRGLEDEYSEFVSREFIPKCDKVGLRSVGGYYVEVGVGPRIISVKSVDSLQDLYKAMEQKTFKELVAELKKLVEGYRTKILVPTGRTRDRPYELQKGVWKVNQYYDILPGCKKQYADFIVNKYIPTIESKDYLEVTGGWNVLVGGFSEIIGELTFKDPVDIGRLMGDAAFRELTQTLRRDYVTNYSVRIMRTTERFDEPRWFQL